MKEFCLMFRPFVLAAATLSFSWPAVAFEPPPELCQEGVYSPCCMRDEGGPFEVAL